MQKLSSNHKIIVKVQQLLGTNEINSHTPFDPIHPKIIKITFSFPEFAPTCKKLIHSIYSFLQPILESCNKTAKKFSFFINLFWRYGWLKDPKIWLAENILNHISGTKICQIRDLYRNMANNINVHYRTDVVKINYQIFQKIKKALFLTHFWLVYFPNFGGKKSFQENLALSRTTSYGFLVQLQNSKILSLLVWSSSFRLQFN